MLVCIDRAPRATSGSSRPNRVNELQQETMIGYKIPIISPKLILLRRLYDGLIFRGSLFTEELIIGGNFAFENGLGR